MRTHQQSSWLYWMTALLAAAGLVLGTTACEPNEGVYEGSEDEAAVIDEQQEEEFGTFDQQREEEVVGTEPVEQEEITPTPGQPLDEGEQQAEMGEQEEDISLEDLDPSQISDQDLAQFAQLRLKLEQARQGGLEGEVGGGPVEGEMEEWETEMIQAEGMSVDRYLGIRMMLQESPELQQRYEQVLGELHQEQ